jgi:prevent-host-death family protein
MVLQMNVQDAKASLSRLLVAAERGQEVIIARSGKPVVKLVPMPEVATRELGFIPGEVSDEALRPLDADELRYWE